MEFVHLVAAILAVWRITDLLTVDRISLKLRQRFPWYVFGCQRCLSVWAGVFVTAIFFLWPWANWPLAFSWLYIWHNETVTIRHATKHRDLHIRVGKDNKADILQNQLFPHEIAALTSQILPKQDRQAPDSNGGNYAFDTRKANSV